LKRKSLEEIDSQTDNSETKKINRNTNDEILNDKVKTFKSLSNQEHIANIQVIIFIYRVRSI
jgi:hypothetical protein